MAVEKALVSGSTSMLLLKLLAEKGCLTSYEKETGGKVRKYYSITKEGKRCLDRLSVSNHYRRKKAEKTGGFQIKSYPV